MAQDKLIKGTRHEDLAEVDKGKVGSLKKIYKHCGRTGYGVLFKGMFIET